MARDLTEERYGSVWQQKIQPLLLDLIHGLCILCFAKSKYGHHLYYSDFFGRRVKDHEIPGWTAVPLCSGCHTWVHHFSRWVQFKYPNEHLSHNKRHIVWYLRFRFVVAYIVVRVFWVLYRGLILVGVIGLLSALILFLLRSRQPPPVWRPPLNDVSQFSNHFR